MTVQTSNYDVSYFDNEILRAQKIPILTRVVCRQKIQRTAGVLGIFVFAVSTLLSLFSTTATEVTLMSLLLPWRTCHVATPKPVPYTIDS